MEGKEIEGKQQRRGLVMSVERADNGALLDYTDLFGPAGANLY